ncbi:MAG: glycoside hydrolase family 38 C-terminal domain-containing protein, partial [Syntrophothermus sp.]
TIQLPGKEPVQEIIDLKPVRHWTIYLVQHTHTDIGYTRPQTEILPEHLRYIDYALDYCDQTDSLPADARFRWTCETSWAVNEYLKTRPDSQLKRLLKRVKEGRIELTGLYLNSSDLSDEATIAASLQPVKFFRNLGFPVRAAMQDDINGVPWCLADYLGDAGIGLLNMGQNVDRARKPFERPTTFLWESPSGKRIMVNRAEHYMLGNTLGLLSGVESLEKNLFSHLRDIAGKGYPFDEYAIQFSGYFTDNSPPSTTACKVVDDWNRQYIWPALKLATISEFPDTIKKKHFGELPVVCGAWPDWWIDGFGSAPVTTAYTRRAHEDYLVNNALLSFSRLWEDEPTEHMKNLQQQVEQDLAFYDEHTFGAAESITDPLCENSVVQLGEKLSYTWEAVKKSAVLREEVMGLLQSHLPVAPDAPTITVFNTMNFTRSGCTALYADNQILPRDRQFYLEDPDGNIVNVQVNKERPEGNYWMIGVHDILPAGYTSYKVRISKEPVIPKPEQRFHGILENNWYRLEMDTLSGKILSIRDKILKRELIDVNDTNAFGGIIHETLGKNREQVSNGRLEEYSREVWKNIKISTYVNGPLWQSIQLTGQVAGSITEEGIRCEIRVYVNEKKIEFRYSMKMMGITDPEGYYVSFPFAMKNKNQVFYDVAGGVVEAGKDQIPGSATDWQGIQNFVMLRDDSCSITLVSPEIPVVQLGGLNLGKFRSVPEKPAPVVFSWVYNNYWTTNFLASQPGELVWSYDLTSGFYEEKERSRAGSLENASCFAWSQRVPMVARILPATGKAINGQRAARLTMMKPLPGNVLVVDISPAEGKSGIVYHLRETGGNSVLFNASNLLNIPGRKFKFFRQNVLGEQQEPCEKKFLIRPFEEVFILAE